MKSVALPHRDPAWDDRVRQFDSGCLFHTSGWLAFLEQAYGVEVVSKEFTGATEGVHVAGLSRRGPFRLAGSPLPGWKTMRMGPLVNADAPPVAVAEDCEAFGRGLKVSLYELVSDTIAPAAFAEHGWRTEEYGTLAVPLPEDQETLWSGLKKAVRGRIKKGRANGLEVRLGVDDELAHDVWHRSEAIMRHKGLGLGWELAQAEALVAALAPAGQVLGVRVVAPDGHTAACGLFPHDHRSVFLWAGASYAEDRALVPNELMHWAAMEWAVSSGLERYDMYGSGDFKKKFGAVHHEHQRCLRFFNPAARAGRGAYAAVTELGRKMKGGWS